LRTSRASLAAAVVEILDRHLDQRRGLAACERAVIEHRVAVRPDAHAVGHVGAGDLGELLEDLVGSHHRALRRLFVQLGDARRELYTE
jgi:hypothetical protein